ncbi:carbohydrate esterase family 12 protein [Tulasnella calospora MUT 4182]|uniref:Carbohydrate esterase family 12 protein n=1 Tax=Tulasnella calospora MUT 4182 TaxID=1051891 RepID=A0A0C3L4G3_9AGAM|nr:carbohydrate esterase family 12 protein [Tulasnella calospora MUT 4182]
MPAIKSLRLTSRNLHTVVEPLYWERVDLSPVTRPTECVEIIQHLHQNAAHREFVKCLLFSKWRPPPPPDHPPPDSNPGPEDIRPPIETLSGILTRLRNLRAIHANGSPMTCAMYEHLYTLQQLEYVEFAKPPIITLKEFPDFDRLNVMTLGLKAIAVSLGAHAIETVPGVSACARLFLGPSLEKLSTSSTMAPFIHALTNQKSFDQLRHYDAVEPFALGGFTEFYAFAAHCPNLTSLKFRPRITTEITEVDSIPSPPANFLTQLRYFEGTLQLAAQIVPGRPVEKIITAFPSFYQSEASLRRLPESSRKQKALNLTIRCLEDDYLSMISRILPFLEELEISLYLYRLAGVGKVDDAMLSTLCESRTEEWLHIAFDASLKRLSESSRKLKALHLTIRYLEDDHLSIISRILPSLDELEILLYSYIVHGVAKIDTRPHLDQLKPLSGLRTFVLKNLQLSSLAPIVAPEPFPEIAEGPNQIPIMKDLFKDHPRLEYVEVGQTVRWFKEQDCWVGRSPSGSALVNFKVAGSE